MTLKPVLRCVWIASLLPLLALTGGCAVTPSPEHSALDTPSSSGSTDAASDTLSTTATPTSGQHADTAETADEPIEYANFTRAQLELALLSELGGMRGYLPQAAQGYQQLALETEDPQIIRRAVEFASAMGDIESVTTLAALWLEVEPEVMDPHLIIGFQFLEQGLFIRALPHLETVLRLGSSVDFTAMSARTYVLENRQRDVIINEMSRLREIYPDEASLYYALIQMYDQNGDSEEASQRLQEARQRFGETPRAALIEAQLFQTSGRAEEAEWVLRDSVTRFPEHRLLRFSLAQILVQNGHLADAAHQFEELLARQPQDLETLYSLALLNLEMDELARAEIQLQELLAAGHRRNEANFYLGYIFDAKGEWQRALRHYQQIRQQSNVYVAAQRQILNLYIQLEQFSEASSWVDSLSSEQPGMAALFAALQAESLLNAGRDQEAQTVLDAALEQHPDSLELLFTRTLLSERSENMAQLERDLRRIIALDPANAQALNHLGYALTVRTERYDEALALIERALSIMPDDPAIIDSLGWVQFKLARYDDALANLWRAYEAYPDPEVAAHLGEALWVTGQRSEALEIWARTLQESPDNQHILEVMERLDVEQ